MYQKGSAGLHGRRRTHKRYTFRLGKKETPQSEAHGQAESDAKVDTLMAQHEQTVALHERLVSVLKEKQEASPPSSRVEHHEAVAAVHVESEAKLAARKRHHRDVLDTAIRQHND